MTYVSKKEKVFALPEQEETSSLCLSTSETRLKRFPSVSDRRAWTSEECQRYQHFYGLVNGSETSLSKSSSFKYIPFDVLLAILMAEKDAYIQELLDKQEDSKSCCGGKANVLYKADGFEDSDDDREALIRKDAEVVSLKNKIAGLESELEDYRDTLTKAMHKLENMDAIMSENNLLREKITYSEETIKCLEQKKAELEKELEYWKNTFVLESKGEEKRMLGRHHWDGGDGDEIVRLSSERDILLLQVEELQRELERAKMNAAEIEVLRKISQSTSSSLEEVSRENECYRKKLESMKCLEKHIEDLKKQAVTLTDKYKRESQKANDHLKQINVNARELQLLREERDRLQRRVNELMAYESQYISLEAKLHQVEVIIDENEMLNKKLIQLNRLEQENEQLKKQMHDLKSAEIQVVEDKEKIVQLQSVLTNQEEEIRKMVQQIEDLSHGYSDKNEIHRLRNELEEKNGKLKKYEKQLADIPVLESEIDELKNKLQKCIEDFKTDKDLLRRLQEELEACQKRCHELEEMAPLIPPPPAPSSNLESTPSCAAFVQTSRSLRSLEEKAANTTETPARDNESQYDEPKREDKGTEASFIEGHSMRLQELEEQNQNLKIEVNHLQGKLTQINSDDLFQQSDELKNLVTAKEKRIAELNAEVDRLRRELKACDEVKQDLVYIQEEMNLLKDENCLLKEEIDWHENELKEAREFLRVERKSRAFAVNMAKQLEERLQMETEKRKMEQVMTKLSKEEANVAKQEIYLQFSLEIDGLKSSNRLSRKLIADLKTENEILRDMREYSEKREKLEQKLLISKLKAEVKVLQNLSKPELERECEALKDEVKKLLAETDSLLEEVADLKSSLNFEKMAKDNLENEVTTLQAELSACVAAGNEVLGREMAAKESLIQNLQMELSGAMKNLESTKNDLETATKDARVLRDENVKLTNSYNNLLSRQKDMESERSWLLRRVEELTNSLKLQEDREQNSTEIINAQKNEVAALTESVQTLREKVDRLENLLKAKEEEVDESKKVSWENANELNKLQSEMEVLRNRLAEKDSGCASEVDYEKDLEEKYALEEALRKIENELDELKVKLEECKAMEEEMANLKSKRDSLLEKMSVFESEIDALKKKLGDFESLRYELDQLKAEKKNFGLGDTELCRLLEEERSQVESLKLENENLKEELTKAEDLLDVCRKLQRTIPQSQVPTQEFFTPPALPSPDSSHRSEETILLETHKKEMTDLENKFKVQMEALVEKNAEKVKKIVENHEKETNFRNKTFNDSINSIRTGYENDIRRLVEKHKRSIMRLQGLHEDQVQELNTNHETQMEAMQTQHENVINDVRTESVEKCKQLREQHNREIRELELKYEGIMREKEAEFLAAKAAAESTQDNKQMMENLNLYYQNTLVELEEKHIKELKKCKKTNLKIIELMKNKYEALLVEERKKYEEQLEEMLLRLNKGKPGDVPEAERSRFVEKGIATTTSPRLEFLEILQKIINEGLESLTFEEVVVVHSKTCFMPGNMEDDCGGAGEIPANLSCRHRDLMAAEKEELLKRIFHLEHEIVIKQLETHEAIVNMETAERYRLQELKNALCTAQQKNTELKRLLSNQSKLQMDLKIDRYMLDKQASLHETNVMEKVKELEREKAERRRLEEELQRERTTLKHLTSSLESEKERFELQRKKDAEYVDSIRRRLEEALNHEQMMEAQLDYETRLRSKLESELQANQKSFNYLQDLPSTQLPVESKAVKNIKNFDQCGANKETHSRSKSKHRSKSKTHNHNL